MSAESDQNASSDFAAVRNMIFNNRITVLHYSIGTLVLALVLRTWLVMGLIEPLTVSGSSMAPALRGPHYTITCTKCGQQFDIEAEFQTERIECLRCGFAGNSAIDLPVQSGDALIVDRMAFQFRLPRRWEPIVFRSPEDGQLTVKRVVGLPGETVELRNGDVWIDDKMANRSFEESLLPLSMKPVMLADDELYVLGDNTSVSIDSRHWGPLPLRLIVGRPLGVR